MNLQEAINELEKGARTYKAFQVMDDVAKTVLAAQKELRDLEISTTRARVENESAKDTLEKARLDLEDTKKKAKEDADRILDSARASAEKITVAAQKKVAEFEASVKEMDDKVVKTEIILKKKQAEIVDADKELSAIKNQIDDFKVKFKNIVG